MTTYSISMPDMSRNIALAGKTVSSKGMNITYDEDGYAIKAENYSHQFFAKTERSIRAPSKDAVLASAERSSYGGSAADQAHFSDKELAWVADLRQQVADGTVTQREADALLEEVRRKYGYSGGASGNEYVALNLPAYPLTEQPAVAVAAEQPAQTSAQSVQSEAAQVSAQSVQSAPAPAASPAAARMQDSYQAELRLQQQAQTLRAELKEQRTQDALLKFSERERVPDALLDMMLRDDEDKDKDE